MTDSDYRTSVSPSLATDTLSDSDDQTPSPPSGTEEEAPSGTEAEDGSGIKKDMLHGNERTGLRGRNVEDLSVLEEEGLLKRVVSGEKQSRSSPKGEVRVERVLDSVEGDEGLNNPRDRNAFALLVLLCTSLWAERS